MLAFTKSFTMRHSGTLLIFAFAGILLLNGLKVKRSSLLSQAPGHDHTSTASELSAVEPTTGNDSDATQELEIQIKGYWKEVRASLGLPPLPDTIVVPLALNLSSGDLTEALGSVLAEDKRHLRRVGRLNPSLRRRRLLFAPPNTFPHSREHRVQGEAHQVEGSARLGVGSEPLVDVGSLRDHGFADSKPTGSDSDGPCDTSIGLSSVSSPNAYPDLFIASDIHDAPRTPVGALAASFRAIAVRELKAKSGRYGGAHLRRGTSILR